MDIDPELDFAGALRALESIVKLLEGGDLSLEESLAKFEEGVGLARRLEEILSRAERRVEEILAEPRAVSAQE